MNPSIDAAPPRQLLRDLASGRWRSEVLRVFMALDLPEQLGHSARSVADLASATHTDRDALDRFLSLAESVGLLTRASADSYQANAATAALRADGPAFLDCRHMLAEWARIAWAGLENSVRSGRSGFREATGGGVFDWLDEHPAESAIFQRFQGQVTRDTASCLVASDLLPEEATVVDVGGGTGTMSRELVAARPDLRCVSFDRAQVVPGRQGVPACSGEFGERLTYVCGDFFVDDRSIPTGGDIYLLSQVLHDWADHDAVRILDQVAAAMASHSRMIIIESLLDTDPPPLLRYLDVLMLTAWGSRERSLGGYTALLKQSGLEVTAVSALRSRRGLTALVARQALCATH